jgi:hypothetical protein
MAYDLKPAQVSALPYAHDHPERVQVVVPYKPDDPICYRDKDGHIYAIGEWTDGSLFKTPF